MKRITIFVIALLLGFTAQAKGKSRAFVYYYDQQYGLYDYFIRSDDTHWDEINVLTNKPKFKFETVTAQPWQMILHDESRNNYIRLTSSMCFVGNDKDNTNRKLYDGFWTNVDDGPTASSLLEKNTNIFIYEKKECRGFFTRGTNGQWQQYTYDNGMLLNTYTVAEETRDYIILSCDRGGYFVKLTNGCCCYSTSLHGAYNSMYNGKWSRGSLSGESASPTTTKDKAFAYYKSGVTSSYYGYFTWVSGDKWEERRLSDDKVLYHFRLLSEAAGATILFDEERGLYVRLTNSECYLSYKSDDINEKKYDGAWVTFDYGYSLTLVLELDINIFVFESAGYSGYYSRSNDGFWLEYASSGGRPVNTYVIIEETSRYLILYCGNCGYYVKLTEDGYYYSPTRNGEYTKKASGKWSAGKVQVGPSTKKTKAAAASGGKTAVSADPLVALTSHVKDSVMRLMKLPALTNKAIADKKIDKKNLQTVASDIARQYLTVLKNNALKKFNGKTIKISAYDKQKQLYTLVWNTDIFTVAVPAADADAFKSSWGKMVFSEPDYYFDGSKFHLSAVKIACPAPKKTYVYDIRGQKRPPVVVKVGDLDVALPG